MTAALASGDCARLAQLTCDASTDVVRKAGCDALAKFAYSLNNNAEHAAVAAGLTRAVVEALVSALHMRPVSVLVLKTSLVALFLWCMHVPQARITAGAVGAIDAVVAVMGANPACDVIQMLGCRALAELLKFSPENKRLAVNANVVSAVLNALRSHASFAEMSCHACAALCLSVTNEYGAVEAAAANRVAAKAQGAIELVTAALIASGADVVSCQWSTKTLAELIISTPEDFVCAQRYGAFEATVQAMHSYPHELNLQINGCCILSRMTEDPDAKAVAPHLEVHMAVILDAMARFPAEDVLLDFAFPALSELLSCYPRAREDGKHAGAIACLVNAMRRRIADADMQQHVCAGFTRLVAFQEKNIAEAFRLGAFLALVEVLKMHAADPDVMGICLESLLCIQNNKDAAWPADLPTADDNVAALHATLVAMRTHPGVLSIQSSGCNFLASLSCISASLSCISVDLVTNAVSAAVAALRRFSSDALLSCRACVMIGNMLGSLIAKDFSCGLSLDLSAATITAAVDVLRAHTTDALVQQYAAYMMKYLLSESSDFTRAARCSAVVPLCTALRTHIVDAVAMQQEVLVALYAA